MVDRELASPIGLGAAFAVFYWVVDTVVTSSGSVGTVLTAVGVVMVVGWSLLAASLFAPDPRRTTDFTEEVIVLGLYWAVLFGGTALVITVVFTAIATVVWPADVATTVWFGTILAATVVLGIVSIVVGGIVRRGGLPSIR